MQQPLSASRIWKDARFSIIAMTARERWTSVRTRVSVGLSAPTPLLVAQTSGCGHAPMIGSIKSNTRFAVGCCLSSFVLNTRSSLFSLRIIRVAPLIVWHSLTGWTVESTSKMDMNVRGTNTSSSVPLLKKLTLSCTNVASAGGAPAACRLSTPNVLCRVLSPFRCNDCLLYTSPSPRDS